MREMMSRTAGAVLLSWCLLVTAASAQVLNFGNLVPGENRVAVTMGMDPAVLGALTYTRTAAWGERPVAYSLELALPIAGLDVRDYRALAGAQLSLARWKRWRVAGRAVLVSEGTRNDIFDAHSLGADLTIYAGFYGTRRFAGLEGGFEKAIVTHISHRAWYRDHFYEGAVDGWYSSMGGMRHTGVVGGIGIGRLDVAFHAGLHWSEGGHALLPPVDGTLSFGSTF